MIQEQMFPDKTAQNEPVKLTCCDGAAGSQIACRKRGLKTRSVAPCEQMADLKNRHRRKASKQLVTSDLHCKNGSILLYRHIFSKKSHVKDI